MVNFCCVRGCGHRSNRDAGIRFFRIPAVPKKSRNEDRELMEKQRRAWLRQIHRKDVTDTTTQPWHRVCSSHFLSGQPADYKHYADPDWKPSVAMGHSLDKKGKADAFLRILQRNKKKKRKKRIRASSAASARSDADTGDSNNKRKFTKPAAETSSDTDTAEDPASGDAMPPPSDNCEKTTQTDVTAQFIHQLEDVIHHYTLENQRLKEQLQKSNTMGTREFFQDKPDRIRAYTGLPNMAVVLSLLSVVTSHLRLRSDCLLDHFQQLMLALMRLRMNLPLQMLADMFRISKSMVHWTFHSVLDMLHVHLRPLICWPDREVIERTMPSAFLQHFGRRVSVIVDCVEVRLDKALNTHACDQSPSNYSHGNIVKFLIGMTAQGAICFVSETWGGGTTDRDIAEKSSFLKNLEVGDLVLAYRGFGIDESAGLHCAEVQSFDLAKGEKRLSAFEAESTRNTTSVRSHVERVIGILRQKYQILDSSVPLSFTQPDDAGSSVLDKIVAVCCGLVNHCPSGRPQETPANASSVQHAP